MKTSNEVAEIQKALSEFKGIMPPVKRDKEVAMKGQSKTGKEYNLSYDYAPLESIQDQARPFLNKLGLAVVQMLGRNDIGPCIYTRVCHSSGQFIEADWNIDLTGIQKEQDRGAKITFNKRYAYTSALDIILENEDSDAVGVSLEKQNQSNKKTSSLPKDELTNPGDFVVTFGTKFKGKKLSEMSPEDVDKNIEYWQGQEKKTNKPLSGEPEKFVFYGIKHLQNIGFYPPTTQEGEIK